jgi:hypothetical protein
MLAPTVAGPGCVPGVHSVRASPSASLMLRVTLRVPLVCAAFQSTATLDTGLPNRSLTRTTSVSLTPGGMLRPSPETFVSWAGASASALACAFPVNASGRLVSLSTIPISRRCIPAVFPSVQISRARPSASVVTTPPVRLPEDTRKFTSCPESPTDAESTTRTTTGFGSTLPTTAVCASPEITIMRAGAPGPLGLGAEVSVHAVTVSVQARVRKNGRTKVNDSSSRSAERSAAPASRAGNYNGTGMRAVPTPVPPWPILSRRRAGVCLPGLKQVFPGSVSILREGVIRIAVQPVLAGLGRGDHWVLSGAGVFARVLVW